MSIQIPPMQEHDLPKREKSFWRMTGPGAVMVGLAIGSGEMVLWPWITAKFGAGMAWAAVLGIFIQMWINFEIGRWAIATGESAFTGFARVSRNFIYFFMAALFVLAWLPGWARATGVILRHLVFGLEGPGADWQWTILVYIAVFLLLFGPKRIYATLERVVSVLVLVVVFGMIAVVFRIGTWEHVVELGAGLVNFGNITLAEDFSFMRFFGALVFVGAGGFGQLYYAYYLRDKGIGMGKQIPELQSALRDQGESRNQIGYTFPDTEENQSRFRDWFLYVKLDNVLYFFFLNTFITLLFMYGALVVFHANGIVPTEANIIWDLSQLLEPSMGQFGHYLFLVVALAAMFSTQLAVCDGGWRIWTDMVHTNIAIARRYTQNQLYLRVAILLACVGIFSIWFLETFDVSMLDFFFINAAINGGAMAIWVPLILYINIRHLPKSARPHPINIGMMLIATLFFMSFALYTVWDKVT